MSAQPHAPDTASLSALLAQYLPAQRVAPSGNVARAAVEMARRWAPELEPQAQLAGLLHDNAKGLPQQELLASAEELRVPITDIERRVPALLHGKVGAALLPQRFGVEDAEVEQAIRDHVTGRTGMPLLSQILYVADQAAADRDFSGVDDLRAVMLTDLDAAVLLVAKHKILHSAKRGALLEPNTVELYNSLAGKPHG